MDKQDYFDVNDLVRLPATGDDVYTVVELYNGYAFLRDSSGYYFGSFDINELELYE